MNIQKLRQRFFKRIEELEKYCWQDVETTEECYLKLKELEVVSE